MSNNRQQLVEDINSSLRLLENIFNRCNQFGYVFTAGILDGSCAGLAKVLDGLKNAPENEL